MDLKQLMVMDERLKLVASATSITNAILTEPMMDSSNV